MDRTGPEHIQLMQQQQPSGQRRRHAANSETATKQKNVYKAGYQQDTSLTKVFVGGLAWETTSESLQKHFSVYGEIVEAAVIVDRQNGRSKGYGFVTYKDEASAERAIQDPNPVIDDRKTNCVLAAEGVRKRYTNGSGNEPWMKVTPAISTNGSMSAVIGGGTGTGGPSGNSISSSSSSGSSPPWGYYVVYGQPPFHTTDYGFQPVIYIPPGPMPPTSVYGAYIPVSFTIPTESNHDILDDQQTEFDHYEPQL